MRVLVIAATPFFSDRGCHIRIYNEAKYLGKLGAEVRLCTYHIGQNIEGLDIKRIKGPKWYKKTSPGFHWGKIWLDLKLLFLCRKEIKKFQPDVIHAHLYEGLAIGYLAKKLACKKILLVFDLQGNIDEEFGSYSRKNSIARKFFTWLSKKITRWADKIVVSSENVRIWTSDVQIVRDGVDLELPERISEPKLEDKEKIERLKNWKEKEKILMYIGGISDNKGVGMLLEAFFDFSQANRKWKLALLGYGSDEEKYKKFIKEKDIENLATLTGRVDYFSLPHYLACADAVIDPKKESSESGKLMVYMAFNLPIICIDSEFTRSRLGESGFYLKSIENLGKTLDKIENVEVVEYKLENLSEEKEVEKLYSIFNELISR